MEKDFIMIKLKEALSQLKENKEKVQKIEAEKRRLKVA